MIPAIVFSRDRACQLDALLHSIREFAFGLFAPLHVLYTSSDADFEHGYSICASEHSAILVREANFREDTLLLLPEDGPVCFFTDDDVFYRWVGRVPLKDAFEDERILAFSLRLGRNTSYCYPLAQTQPPPRVHERRDFLTWFWQDAAFDFSYPLSLDGHVLRAEDVRTLVNGHDFQNPNQLEDVLARQASRMSHRPKLAAFANSCLVGVPANLVNVTHRNRFAGLEIATARALNERYLAGERIDRIGMEFSQVVGAHQEIEYAFRGAA